MKKSITIRIPEPCHEDWAKMTSTEKGRHCAVCTKEVVDFTKLSDEQIIKEFQKDGNLCGRFKSTQVDREMKLERKKKNSFLPIAASFMLPLSILATQDAFGQNKQVLQGRINKVVNSSGETQEKKDTSEEINKKIIVKGVITDNENLPLAGVNIVLKGTSTGTQTNFDGNYTIEAEAGQTLVLSYVGFETEEVFVSNISQRIDLKMNYSDELMGDIVVGIMIMEEPNKKTNPAAKPYANMESNPGSKKTLTQDERTAQENAKEFERLKKARYKAELKEKRAKRKENG